MTVPTDDVVVRRATQADFAAVVRLRDQLAVESHARRPDIYRQKMLGHTEALFAAQICAPNDPIYVAERAGAVVGYAWATFGEGTGNNGMYPRRFAFVSQLVVSPSAQMQGAARALLAAVETDARADGVEVLQLFVDTTNIGGKAFYDRVGWESVTEMRQKLLRNVSRLEGE